MGLFAALVIGTLTGRTLRLWANRQPLMFTFALLLTGLGTEGQLSGNEQQQLVDVVVGAGLINALWPSGRGRKRRAISASVRQLTRRWSRGIPIG